MYFLPSVPALQNLSVYDILAEIKQEEKALETKTVQHKKIIVALSIVLVVLLLVAIILPVPVQDDPEQTTAPVTTVPETTAEPTLPQPEAGIYGPTDFQFDGDYLTCLAGKSILGIDVSEHQREIDWPQVKAAGIEFVIIRVGYRGYETGNLNPDKYAKANYQGAIDAGLDVGVYFFSQATSVEEAIAEARFVLDFTTDWDLKYPVVFDWEYISSTARTANVDRQTLTDCSIAFCEEVKNAGRTPMVYFNWRQGDNRLFLYQLEDYPFWLALYSYRMTYPYKVEMWQYTNEGKVPGIAGDVDINLWFDYE